MVDYSNGYEKIANKFIQTRSKTIGSLSVKSWSKNLTPNSSILDLGCGNGMPISKTLIDLGFNVYGIDSSITLLNEFSKNFPKNPILYESVQKSNFFNLKFDAIIAWGLLFLLQEEEQKLLITKISIHLKLNGKFLFTSPEQNFIWQDSLTNLTSQSLGKEKYVSLLKLNGFGYIEVFTDESDNFYYSSIKIK